ncbi:MAG: endonuclease [Alphaproteobacteria bacterium]|nr:endonuclease [Alphaproteobacteria bacterium]
MTKYSLSFLLFLFPTLSFAGWFWQSDETNLNRSNAGNRYSQSFYAVKQVMLNKIYYDYRRTLYCNAEFDRFKKIKKSQGFELPDIRKVDFKVYDISSEELKRKSERLEWEHIVPAENFGRTFKEWSQGHKNCVSNKGKHFKGRSCAVKENENFRYMYTDMYNLYPVIGAVNYLRANFNFTQFNQRDNVKVLFGGCPMKISRNKAEPRDEVKGLIARTYFYMEQTYPRYKIGEPMRGILKTWDKKYPVTAWECKRAYRIEKVQGNANEIVKKKCENKGLYPDNKGIE